jgi:hypothetical protein
MASPNARSSLTVVQIRAIWTAGRGVVGRDDRGVWTVGGQPDACLRHWRIGLRMRFPCL